MTVDSVILALAILGGAALYLVVTQTVFELVTRLLRARARRQLDKVVADRAAAEQVIADARGHNQEDAR